MRIKYKQPHSGPKEKPVVRIDRDDSGVILAYVVRERADHWTVTRIDPEHVTKVSGDLWE